MKIKDVMGVFRSAILLLSAMHAFEAYSQTMQYNAATGQITNLSEAKSQKIID
jgi:hypothetical protein